MLEHLFPDILRAVISTTANVLMLMTLLQPKYSRKVTCLTMLGILTANLATAFFCYLSGNLTLLSKLDILLFTVLCFAVRPLFKDSFMEWLFSYLTVMNISEVVIILSFIGSRPLPYPVYANSLLRLLLFTAILFSLRRYVIPVYRQAGEHWTAYFAVAMCFNMALSYYFLFSEDIVASLTEHTIPLLLLIFTGLAAYVSIFLSLRNLQREYQTREENRLMQTEREYLELAADTMSQRLELMEEVSRLNSHAAHDRRHFNNVLLGLLGQGKSQDAYDLLRHQNLSVPSSSKVYCQNPTVNAAVSHYANLAEQAEIPVDIRLDISNDINVDALELAMVISNLMENAIHACTKLSPDQPCFLYFTGLRLGRLLLEIENPCASDTVLDEHGYPVPSNDGHGIGSRSVIAFAKKYDGELLYKIENDVFQVRLLL